MTENKSSQFQQTLAVVSFRLNDLARELRALNEAHEAEVKTLEAEIAELKKSKPQKP